MSAILKDNNYDIFISYRQKDNKYDGWVTEFVNNLKKELEATFKEEVSVYFDINSHDGILETYNVDASLKEKLKCLVFVPIISQTYCDPKSFAWQNEFVAFNRMAKNDFIGRDIKLQNGNITSRILPVKIHDIDSEDKELLENELDGPLRAIEFIYREPGVNRPLTPYDDDKKNLNSTRYRNQINKVANAVKEIISGLKKFSGQSAELPSKIIPFQSLVLKKSQKKIITIAILVLILIVSGWLIIPRLFNSNEINERSIAVLPFKLLSDEPDKQYLADGMMEAILLNLQKFKDLRVLSRTSVEQYRATLKSANEIGKELEVTYLLEGSFQKEGDNAKLIVKLIKANKGTGTWGNDYKRKWKDIFSVQSDIAQAIAGELHTVITPEVKKRIESVPTTNFTAYDLYLKANDYHKVYTKVRDLNSYQKAVFFYKAALELDSAFARAYTGLGIIYFERYSWKSFYKKNFLDSCIMLADKALSFDDQIEEAFYTKGLYFEERGSINDAFENFDKALKINPNYYLAYSAKGRIYTSILSDYVRGIDNFKKALNLIRGNERPLLLQETGWAFLDVGFYENAKTYFEEKLTLDGDKASYYFNISGIEFALENFEKALKLDKQANEIDSTLLVELHEYIIPPGHLKEAYEYSKKILRYIKKTGTLNLQQSHRIGYVYWQMGRKAEADSCFKRQIIYCEESIKLNRSAEHWKYSAQYDLAATYAFLGNKDKAYKYLDEFNRRDFFPLWWLNLAKNDPLFESIRKEERFKEVVQNMEARNKKEHDRVKVWLENHESAD
jgi:TolB-like protein